MQQPFTKLFLEAFTASGLTNRELAKRMNAAMGLSEDAPVGGSSFRGYVPQDKMRAVTDRTISRWKVGVLPARVEWMTVLREVLWPDVDLTFLNRMWAEQLRSAVGERYGVSALGGDAAEVEIPTRPLAAYLKRLATRFDTRQPHVSFRCSSALWRPLDGGPRTAFVATVWGALEEMEANVAVAVPRVVFHKEHLWQAAAAETFLAECSEWVLDADEVREMVLGLMSSGLVEMYAASTQK